ncbi:unnamed protein product, partial [Dicrocoelium dendriticum]
MLAAAYLINLRPLQSLRFLDNLISLVNPAKRRICVRAMDIISQLFQRSLLPKDRVLHPFSSRPTDLTGISNDSATVEEALCLWYFEEEIKFKYTKFIKSLERLLLSNTVDAFKRRALSILTQLLIKIPEGRPLALAIIINKLGDGNKAFASAVIHKLRLIVGKKPQLTGDVVEEIRSFLFRPNLLERAKYYAVVLLSCLELKNSCSSEGGKNSAEIAVALIKVYAAFFHAAVKASEIPERLTLALLAGLGRATPFVP